MSLTTWGTGGLQQRCWEFEDVTLPQCREGENRVEHMNAHDVKILRGANQQLQAILRALARKTAELKGLEGQVTRLQRENDQFSLTMAEYRDAVRDFAEEQETLRQEQETLRRKNQQFATSNAIYSQLLHSLEGILDTALAEIKPAARRGEDVSRQDLEKALESFAAQKRALQIMEAELSEQKDAALERWGELVEQVGSMKARGVEALQEAGEQLQATLREIARHAATKRELETQVTQLRGEVSQLQEIHRGIAAVTALYLEAANQIQRVTTAMSFFLKGVLGFGDQENVQQSRILLFCICTIGYVAYRALVAQG